MTPPRFKDEGARRELVVRVHEGRVDSQCGLELNDRLLKVLRIQKRCAQNVVRFRSAPVELKRGTEFSDSPGASSFDSGPSPETVAWPRASRATAPVRSTIRFA